MSQQTKEIVFDLRQFSMPEYTFLSDHSTESSYDELSLSDNSEPASPNNLRIKQLNSDRLLHAPVKASTYQMNPSKFNTNNFYCDTRDADRIEEQRSHV